MSLKENDVFLERMADEYRSAVQDKNWDRVREIGLELEEAGMSQAEVELSKELTDEEVREYKAWDERVNGDIDTQMDDNS